MPRPTPDDYDPYFAVYIDRTTEDDVDDALVAARAIARPVLHDLRDDGAQRRYAPDKWSIKEVVAHLIDTERIMTARALAFARGETAHLPGFDHNAYAARSRADDRRWLDLLVEYDAVRDATRSLFRSFDASMLDTRGIADDATLTPRAIGFTVAGHERHHAETIRTRYLA